MLLGVLAGLAAVGFAIPAAAASVTSVTGCTEITTPGTYRLDADITGGGRCIDITAGNVTLLLNGHTMTNNGLVDTTTGIFVHPPNPLTGQIAHVNIVGPGTLTGYDRGILFDASDGSVSGVRLNGEGSGLLAWSSAARAT
jgi:hypothetical protein